MSEFSLHNVEIPLQGMGLRCSLLSGGMNKLIVRKSHRPPHIEKRANSMDFVESSISPRGIYWKAR